MFNLYARLHPNPPLLQKLQLAQTGNPRVMVSFEHGSSSEKSEVGPTHEVGPTQQQGWNQAVRGDRRSAQATQPLEYIRTGSLQSHRQSRLDICGARSMSVPRY